MNKEAKEVLFKMITEECVNETALFLSGKKEEAHTAAIRWTTLDKFISRLEEETGERLREELNEYKDKYFSNMMSKKIREVWGEEV